MTPFPFRFAKWSQHLAIFGLFLPLLAATVVQAWGLTPRAMQNVPALPGLVFDQYLVDLGEVPPSETVYARFVFKNTGTNPVHIQELKPSCGCLQPQLDRDKYLPGEMGTFLLKVQTANQEPGAKEYTVNVHYADPEPHDRTVTFRVDLPHNQVLVRPRALVFYQSESSEETTQELTVTDLRAENLHVMGVKSSSDFVDVVLNPETTIENGATRHHVNVIARGKIPPGRHQALVTIYTDDPKYSELRVPLWVFGPGSELTRTPPRGGIQRVSHAEGPKMR